jgi:hypothetical protein
MQAEVPLGLLSLDPYKKLTGRLRDKGVLLVDKHGQAWDQTNWYSINHDVLRKVLAEHSVTGFCVDRKATDAAEATPTLHERPSRGSSRGIADAVYKGSETTQKSTTTAMEVVVLADSPDSAAPPVVQKLSFGCVPQGLHQDVQKLVATRPDGQRYVDLLSAALQRSATLPEPRRIQAPLLWLKKMLDSGSTVDFTAADALAKERLADEHQSRVTAIQMARNSAAADKVRAAQEARTEFASHAIRLMTERERLEFVNRTVSGCVSRKAATEIAQAVQEGRLPAPPFAQAIVIRAFVSTEVDSSPADRGEQ